MSKRNGFLPAAIAAGMALAIAAPAAFAEENLVPTQGSKVSPRATEDFSCGAVTSSFVRTRDDLSSSSSTTFNTIPGASISVEIGAARCVKLLFTAETACSGGAPSDDCLVRATINGVTMFPEDARAIDSEDSTPAGHAYEWIDELGPGTYTFRVQRRVETGTTTFDIDDWTMDVEFSRLN